MNRAWFQSSVVPVVVLCLASGCATTKPHRPDPAQDPQRQIAELQSQLQAKDQEIQDLHYQLESSRQALPDTNFTASGGGDPKNILRVAGVSEIELQKALSRAGFDPGPVDGRLGKKTRAAIKAFQRRHNLSADGVVGEKTWAALRSD